MLMYRCGTRRSVLLGMSLLVVGSFLHIMRQWSVQSYGLNPRKPANRSKSAFHVYQEKFYRPRESKIPKIIHQIWNEELIPDQFVDNIRSLVKYNPHPEWQYKFYTLDQGREFVKQNYPKLLQIYDFSPKYTKPDILRFVLIYHFGGVYFDLDIFGVRPLDRFLEHHDCALNGPIPEHAVAYDNDFQLYDINNAVMICRPGHPFFELLITRTENRSKLCNNSACPMPEFPSPLLFYLQEQTKTDIMPDITDSNFFEPIYDLTVTHLLEKKCSDKAYVKLKPEKKRICDVWIRMGKDNKAIPETSYTVHTWFHTGANNVTTLLNLTISDIVPHVKLLK